MGLKLLKRGGTYYVRGTIKGPKGSISVYETTGTGDEERAKIILAQTTTRLLDETLHGKKATVTFEEAALSYVEGGGDIRFILRCTESGEERGIALYFKGKLLRGITQGDLDQAAKEMLPDASHDTRNRQVYTPFIAVWNHAVRNQWAELRQWARPRKPKGTAQVPRRLRSGTSPVDYERAAKFVAALSPAPAMIMTALFFTGMRPIELFALDVDDVNIAARWIRLRSSKTGEPRGVPMHDFLVPLFEALLKRGERVFRSHLGDPYPLAEDGGGQMKSAINGARRRSGIVNISPYTARHSVSTQLVVNGVHQLVKDQILGHAVDSMSRRYTQIPRQPLIDAINTLEVPDAWRTLNWWLDPVGLCGVRITDMPRKARYEREISDDSC